MEDTNQKPLESTEADGAAPAPGPVEPSTTQVLKTADAKKYDDDSGAVRYFSLPVAELATADEARVNPRLLFAQISKTKLQDNLCMSARDEFDIAYSDPLHAISRVPVPCIISRCSHPVAMSSIFAHYLSHHSTGCETIIDFQVTCANKRKLILFDVTKMRPNENFCLGALVYSGPDEQPSSLPGVRKICLHNAFLPLNKKHLKNHLCILVMACRTSWEHLIEGGAEFCKTQCKKEREAKEIMFFWLTSAPTLRPIFCNITVYDVLMEHSASVLTRIRPFNEPQDPANFYLKDNHYMLLTHGSIISLTQNYSKTTFLEVSVNEFPEFDFVEIDRDLRDERANDVRAMKAARIKEIERKAEELRENEIRRALDGSSNKAVGQDLQNELPEDGLTKKEDPPKQTEMEAKELQAMAMKDIDAPSTSKKELERDLQNERQDGGLTKKKDKFKQNEMEAKELHDMAMKADNDATSTSKKEFERVFKQKIDARIMKEIRLKRNETKAKELQATSTKEDMDSNSTPNKELDRDLQNKRLNYVRIMKAARIKQIEKKAKELRDIAIRKALDSILKKEVGRDPRNDRLKGGLTMEEDELKMNSNEMEANELQTMPIKEDIDATSTPNEELNQELRNEQLEEVLIIEETRLKQDEQDVKEPQA